MYSTRRSTASPAEAPASAATNTQPNMRRIRSSDTEEQVFAGRVIVRVERVVLIATQKKPV
jgi:hypothetical protein